MRIAFVVGGFPRISETWILAQVTGLMDRGHEVDIYARRPSSETLIHEGVAAYNLLRRTYVYDLPTGRAARAARAAGVLLRRLPRNPRAMITCLDRRRFRSTYAVLNNVMFVEPFLDRHYDAVLCHFGGNGLDFVVLKDVFPRTRFVTMFHGDDCLIGDEKGAEAVAPLQRLGDAFLVTTDCFGRANLRRQGFDDRRIVTLRLSFAAEKVPFRERRPAGRTLRLVSIGRLVERKDFPTGIRAVAALKAARPDLDVEYAIIGDGPLRGDLTRLAQEEGVGTAVQLLGVQSDPELQRRLHEADIYLLPSLMEGAGYVLLEAQASGLPVVATRVGGVPEMVREGRSAVLVEPRDVAGTRDALLWLLDHPERWPDMGHEGRRHVEEQHDADRLTTTLEAVLEG
jgi:colanic acid/amylovoran biosynthesis glycosyltransferase